VAEHATMNTRTQIDPPSLPLLRRASTLIAMGTVGLALVAAAPASAENSTPQPKAGTTTTTTTSTTTTTTTLSERDYRSRKKVTRPIGAL
jgi:hypothetical protein